MERLYKSGLITTILGLAIIAFAGLLMYQQKYSATDLAGWIGVALLFLRSKDSLIGLPKKDKNDNGEV